MKPSKSRNAESEERCEWCNLPLNECLCANEDDREGDELEEAPWFEDKPEPEDE